GELLVGPGVVIDHLLREGLDVLGGYLLERDLGGFDLSQALGGGFIEEVFTLCGDCKAGGEAEQPREGTREKSGDDAARGAVLLHLPGNARTVRCGIGCTKRDAAG